MSKDEIEKHKIKIQHIYSLLTIWKIRDNNSDLNKDTFNRVLMTIWWEITQQQISRAGGGMYTLNSIFFDTTVSTREKEIKINQEKNNSVKWNSVWWPIVDERCVCVVPNAAPTHGELQRWRRKIHSWMRKERAHTNSASSRPKIK